MRSHSPAAALNDIKANIELACEFVEGFSFDQFQSDLRTVYAVTRCLEIISEASRRLPADIKNRHPHIPWNDIAAAGSIYRHGYQIVRDELLWRTVQDSLESLRLAVDQELSRQKLG
jgi:uncharacterized protein with HEPN domain